jgi:hypothetical protein
MIQVAALRAAIDSLLKGMIVSEPEASSAAFLFFRVSHTPHVFTRIFAFRRGGAVSRVRALSTFLFPGIWRYGRLHANVPLQY